MPSILVSRGSRALLCLPKGWQVHRPPHERRAVRLARCLQHIDIAAGRSQVPAEWADVAQLDGITPWPLVATDKVRLPADRVLHRQAAALRLCPLDGRGCGAIPVCREARIGWRGLCGLT